MKTPPLTWVRAFCEAGQQGSFKEAAKALNLSPSTVSHEIRKLEDWVQQPLFNRSRRKTELTDEGQRLLALLRPALRQIDEAFENSADHRLSTLRVGMLPFFASELMLPNIHSLTANLGHATVEITSDIHLSALDHSDNSQRLDAVVRYAQEPPPGYASAVLTQVSLAVVTACSKAAENDTATSRRIALKGTFDGWKTLEAAGHQFDNTTSTPIVVDNYLSAMRAVEQGLGVGLAVLPLCEPWLTQGRIRMLSETVYKLNDCYWLVWKSTSPKAAVLQSLAASIACEFNNRAARLASAQD